MLHGNHLSFFFLNVVLVTLIRRYICGEKIIAIDSGSI